jgi:hypothetical protein
MLNKLKMIDYRRLVKSCNLACLKPKLHTDCEQRETKGIMLFCKTLNDVCIQPSDEETFRDMIWQSQHPSDCRNAKLLVHNLNNFQFASDVHSLVYYLTVAMHTSESTVGGCVSDILLQHRICVGDSRGQLDLH